MARVHNNIFVRGLTGAVGDQFVIRKTRSGKTIIANKPEFDENREFSEAQKAQQDAFKRAIGYARLAKTQPLYVQLAKGTDATAYNMAMADWFGEPEVRSIDASGWNGQAGKTVQIVAQDDTYVTRVQVKIHNNGTVLEEGEAVRSEHDSMLWIYTTTTAITPAPGVLLDASAYDMPGNFGTTSVSLN